LLRPARYSFLGYARPFCRAFFIAGGLVLNTHTIAGASDALSAAEQLAQTAQKIDLDIPSQSLASALERYGDSTGREILYNGNLAIGRRSGAVRGLLTPDEALDALLAGTGLIARYMADQSFILESASVVLEQTEMPSVPPDRLQHYYGRIQASLRDALCWNQEARPGRYRIAARFWISVAGNVSRYERLSSTGSRNLDGDVDRILRSLNIGEPPPSGFVQPVTIVILRQAPSVTMGCEEDRRGSQTTTAVP
jgi:hypothetical protein